MQEKCFGKFDDSDAFPHSTVSTPLKMRHVLDRNDAHNYKMLSYLVFFSTFMFFMDVGKECTGNLKDTWTYTLER